MKRLNLMFGGNLLTIVLFAVEKRLRKKSLFVVINMAFADMMFGTVSLPLFVYYISIGADNCHSIKRHKFVYFRLNFNYFVLKIK